MEIIILIMFGVVVSWIIIFEIAHRIGFNHGEEFVNSLMELKSKVEKEHMQYDNTRVN